MNQRFIDSSVYRGVTGVALGGQFIYWANQMGSSIGRANIDGTDVHQLFLVPACVTDKGTKLTRCFESSMRLAGTVGGLGTMIGGIAVDGASIYWANTLTSTIGRANLDGTDLDQRFITHASFPYAVAVDEIYVYWTNFGSNTVGRAKRDGTDSNQSFISGAIGPFGVAVDGTYIYWSNQSSMTIGRANLDGSNVNQEFIWGLTSPPYSIAVDGKYIYWTNESEGTIGRAKLDGTDGNQRFISGATVPFAVAALPEPEPVTPPLQRLTRLPFGRTGLDLRASWPRLVPPPCEVTVPPMMPDPSGAPCVRPLQVNGSWPPAPPLPPLGPDSGVVPWHR